MEYHGFINIIYKILCFLALECRLNFVKTGRQLHLIEAYKN